MPVGERDLEAIRRDLRDAIDRVERAGTDRDQRADKVDNRFEELRDAVAELRIRFDSAKSTLDIAAELPVLKKGLEDLDTSHDALRTRVDNGGGIGFAQLLVTLLEPARLRWYALIMGFVALCLGVVSVSDLRGWWSEVPIAIPLPALHAPAPNDSPPVHEHVQPFTDAPHE